MEDLVLSVCYVLAYGAKGFFPVREHSVECPGGSEEGRSLVRNRRGPVV